MNPYPIGLHSLTIGVFYLVKFNKMNEQNDYLEFTCKLDPENGDKLFVSDGSTVLFEVVNGEKSIGVGLNSQDVKQLIDYLNNCL